MALAAGPLVAGRAAFGDQGGVPGWNDYRAILGEVTATRLGVGTEAMAAVFPGHTVAPLGVMRWRARGRRASRECRDRADRCVAWTS